MSTQVRSSTAPDRQAGELQFIDRQLRRTRRQVKLIDLSTMLAQLACGWLVALLVLALIDHWVFGLGFAGRVVALVALLMLTVWFLAARVFVLLVRPINPVYAAKTIERSAPTLKNSLINFLLFRAPGASIPPGVLRTLQHEAAQGLQQVPVETAVDRSPLVRAGAILAALVVVLMAYSVLSPKSVWQTVRRVALPWADLRRPARVQIEDVQPGDAEVYAGTHLSVTARIEGVRDDEPVQLVYSTEDGRITDRSVAFQASTGGLLFEGRLPPDDDGFSQDLVYWIQAGDARTRAYRVRVSPAPAIVVKQLDYAFPAYTKLPPKTVRDDGSIEAVEGTRVTVLAEANYPIRSAQLEFDPHAEAVTAGDDTSPVRPLSMHVDGQTAKVSFVLKLSEDRRRPLYKSYQLTLVTQSGASGEAPVLHSIRVLPDLSPEVEILTPEQDRIDVPLDGRQRIEIRGVDPDFGLRRIGLRAVVAGTDLFDRTVFEEQRGRTGQVMAQTDIQPAKLGLAVGDEVTYWAIAEDNRMAPGTDQYDPNFQTTHRYVLRVVAPERRADEPSGEGTDSQTAPSSEQRPSDPTEEDPPPEGEQGESSGSEEQTGEGQQGNEGQPGMQGAGESGEQSEGEPGSQDAGQPDSSSDAGQQANQTPSGQSSEGSSARTGQGEPGETSQGAPESGDVGSAGELTDQEPLHDGEVFERALERMKQDQQSQEGSLTGEQSHTSSDGAAQQEKPNQGLPGDSESSQSDSTTQQPGEPSSESSGQPAQDQAADGMPENTLPESGEPTGQEPNNNAADSPSSAQPADQPSSNPREPGQATDEGSPDAAASPKPEDQQSSGTPSEDERPGQSPDHAQGDPSGQGQQREPMTESGSANTQEPSGQSQNGSAQPGQTAQSDGQTGDQRQGGEPTRPEDGTNADQTSGGEESPTETGEGQSSLDPPKDTRTSDGSNDPGGLTNESPESGEQSATATDRPGRQGSGELPSGGLPSDRQAGQQPPVGDVPEGDDPNVEYARRVTDMVLEYLKDQQDRPSEDLLDDLGWSEEDLRRFVQRWEQLKQAASQDAEAKRELEETLRSLGLQPVTRRVRRGTSNSDQLRGMRERGLQSSPPPRYAEQFDAFKKATSRTQP